MSKRLGRIAAEILEVDGVRLYHDQSLWYLRRQGRAGRASSRLGCQARCMALSCLAPMTGRSAAACGELERRWPRLTEVTGNRAMPGFTAPKLLWLAENEPAIFAACRRVLLPKDYVRLLMTGEALAATGLNRAHMPSLYEGTEPTGRLRTRVAQLWGLSGRPIVAAGAGDNAAGAVAQFNGLMRRRAATKWSRPSLRASRSRFATASTRSAQVAP